MAEKLERMELDLEFKDKVNITSWSHCSLKKKNSSSISECWKLTMQQLMELQELYIYQQQLTEKLSEKLLRTQVSSC